MILQKKKATTDIGLDMDRRFVHIAQALSAGYTDLYYVNIETDEFIEYHSDEKRGLLSEVRRGNDFFPGCARDAKKYIHKEDQKLFVDTMSRAFLKEALKDSHTYEFHYRRILDKKPVYVRMHITRGSDDPNYIVIAVSDIDEIVKQRERDDRIREERLIYAHLQALVGNSICVYVIDPETDRYREFSATHDYTESFSQAKSGEHFFDVVRKVAKEFNDPEDLDRFLSVFTKDNIIAEIESSGLFVLVYRLIMDGKPRYVQMSAAMVEEKEGKRLVVGLNDIDAQYRQKEKRRKWLVKRIFMARSPIVWPPNTTPSITSIWITTSTSRSRPPTSIRNSTSPRRGTISSPKAAGASAATSTLRT